MESEHDVRRHPCSALCSLKSPLSQWTHRESHPDLRHARPASSCWTMSPMAECRMTKFKCRMIRRGRGVVSTFELRHSSFPVAGAGVEPASRRSECRIRPLDDPAGWSRAKGLESRDGQEVHLSCVFRSRPSTLLSRPTPECPAGVEPASPAWKAGAFAARPRAHVVLSSGSRGTRTHNPDSSGHLFSRQVPHPAG